MAYATVPAQYYSGSRNITPPPDPYKNYTNIGNNQYLTKNQQLITGDPNNPDDPLGLNAKRSVAGAVPTPGPTSGGLLGPLNTPTGGGTPTKTAATGGLFGVPWLTRGGTTGPASGTLAGAPPFGYSPSAGGIPQVPAPGASQLEVLLQNLANLGNLGKLSTGIGDINAGLGKQPYTANLPGYQGLLNKASGNTQSLLNGIVPPDVIAQLQQQGAERGVVTGGAGSPNSNAAYLRALGLTSLGLQDQGLKGFTSLVGSTPTGPAFNPTSMLIDPNMQQMAQYLANLYNAAPNPGAAQNNALAKLQAGLRQGLGGTQPTQSGSLVADILNRYAPTATGGGTPPLNPYAPTGVAGTGTPGTYYAPPPVDYGNMSDEDLYNIMMGELPQDTSNNYGNTDTGGYYGNITDQPTFEDYYGLGGG